MHTATKRASTGALVASVGQDDLTRHWSFIVSSHCGFLRDYRRYDIRMCQAFEWVVNDVAKLRDFVEDDNGHGQDETPEGRVGPDRDEFEILRESPMLGDGKYKLEIGTKQAISLLSRSQRAYLARTPPDAEIATTQVPTLSLFVTSLMLDYANAEYEVSASMLAAIKCQDDRVGERGARADWAWDTWQSEWTFRQDNEVWREHSS
jgi:hypothetical protein